MPGCLFSTCMEAASFSLFTSQAKFGNSSKNGVSNALSFEIQRPLIFGTERFNRCRGEKNTIELIINFPIGRFKAGRPFRVKCQMDFDSESVKDPEVVTAPLKMVGGDLSLSQSRIGNSADIKEDGSNADNGGDGGCFGGNDNGNFRGGEGGKGGGRDNEGGQGGNDGEDEFGPILNAEEVFEKAEARGAVLPSDMAEAAKAVGLRQLLLSRYLDLQEAAWPLGIAIRGSAALRNRMLADPSFLFKVFVEIMIDSCCATFAEVQKRGKDFWAEFELYLADLLVGVAVDIALVVLLAPFVRLGQPPLTAGFSGKVKHAIGALPSSVFEAETPGRRFSVQQRIGAYFYKGLQYGVVGFVCGIIGQGIANSIMILKRKLKKTEEQEIPVPPLVQSAALWGVFLAISSNTRYQIINGLERLVEGSPLAKRVPPIALGFTFGVRFANNVYGGMQFVDWARSTGIQ